MRIVRIAALEFQTRAERGAKTPEAVYVLMPQYPIGAYDPKRNYFPIVLDILAQKRHVLVEKPIAMTAAEARGPVQSLVCCFYKGMPPSTAGQLNWLTSDLLHALDVMRFLAGSPGSFADAYESVRLCDAILQAPLTTVRRP